VHLEHGCGLGGSSSFPDDGEAGMLVVLVLSVDVVLTREIGDTGPEIGLAGPAESGGDGRDGVEASKSVETRSSGSMVVWEQPPLDGSGSRVRKRRLHRVRDGS
jgi:hypothetical protein